MSRLVAALCLAAPVCLAQSPSADPFLAWLDHIAQPELDQREQEPTGRGPGKPGRPGDLAEAEPLTVGSECPDDRQAAIEGLDEIAVPDLAAIGGRSRRGSSRSVRPARRTCHRNAC